MSLKTTNQIAIENALQNPKGKNLKLLGPVNNQSFFDIFGLDSKFFYLAEKIENNNVLLRERGIGRIIISDDGYELERYQPLGFYVSGDSTAHPCVNGPIDFNGQVTVSSSYPFSLLESLCEDHCVVACDKQFLPKPVQLSQYSFLGRLDDGVSSLPFESLCESSEFKGALVSAITGYTKQLAFSASKINTKTKKGVIASSIFQLNPTSNPPAKKGTFIYDETDDLLKYYDGTSWRSLSFIKDDLS